MNILRRARRPLCCVSIAAFAAAIAPAPAAQAALVDTSHVLQQSQRTDARAQVNGFLSRADVRAQMEKLGVSPAEARARVASLSDNEVQRIAGHLDAMPAGQGLLGLALAVIIVLGILDLFGIID